MSHENDRLEDLLVECVSRLERSGPGSVEELIRENPGFEAPLRRHLAFLDGLCMIESDRPAAGSGDGLIGESIGGYRLLRAIGHGGMARVYLAEQESLSRRCALKVIRSGEAPTRDSAERFRREALAAARVSHPNVVTVFASGEHEGLLYIAMEYVDGKGLDDVIRERRADPSTWPLVDVVGWGRDLARALAAVHAVGIVHRDIKPSNVRITPDGKAMLIDFGLARDFARESSRLSATGSFVGTPYYAAPEQLTSDGAGIGPATDVYGLGICLYEAVTGRVPFEGKTPEGVFRQILTAEPTPPRRLDPTVPRSLDQVILTAIEKQAGRRYGHAAGLADDLEAVLELRPVSARPDSALRRLAKWSARHRMITATVAIAILAALGAAAAVSVRDAREAEDRRREAARGVATAAARLASFQEEQKGLERLMARRAALEHLMPYRYLADEEVRELEEACRVLDGLQGQREQAFFDMLELLRRAERLDRDAPGLDDTRARIYLEKWRLARAERNPSLAAFYRDRVLESDRDGRYEPIVSGGTRVTITAEPGEAEIHLFRLRSLRDLDSSGPSRLVPVPFRSAVGATLAVAAGTPCLRVVRGAGEVPEAGVIVEVEGRPVADVADGRALRGRIESGGVRALVVAGGKVTETVLPPGIVVRPTAAPLVWGVSSRMTAPVRCEAGTYVALVRAPGFDPQRRVFEITHDSPRSIRLAFRLDPTGSVPAGFVRLNARPLDGHPPVWMMDREVTCREYLEFLNLASTLREIDASDVPIRFPRTASNAMRGGYWPREAGGAFRLSDDALPDHPVLGVSWDDAMAYAGWKTARLRRDGLRFRCTLPEHVHYSTQSTRRYVWGDSFRPHWTKSCHARPRPCVEPVLSYAIDETPTGLLDFAGSAQEWCSEWFSERSGERMLFGGSWAHARPERFLLSFVCGAKPAHAADTYGFRLIATREP